MICLADMVLKMKNVMLSSIMSRGWSERESFGRAKREGEERKKEKLNQHTKCGVGVCVEGGLWLTIKGKGFQ